MSDPKEKNETMQEAYERVFNYDPSEEEVKKHYNDDFNNWLDNFLEE